MAPSTDRKHPFQRIYLLAFLFGCCFFLLLWHNVGGSGSQEPASHHALRKRDNEKMRAVVVLQGPTGVHGTIYFSQDSSSTATHITGSVQGLDANAQRGFHIHQYGDLSGGCNSTGTHYNPFNKTHGAPWDAERHVGDLGNIQVGGDGTASVDIWDYVVQLSGPQSVVGRGMVVHTGTDDLGTKGDEGSRTTGNAGGRAACGVIGLLPVE